MEVIFELFFCLLTVAVVDTEVVDTVVVLGKKEELLEQDSNINRAVGWSWGNRGRTWLGQKLPSKTLS